MHDLAPGDYRIGAGLPAESKHARTLDPQAAGFRRLPDTEPRIAPFGQTFSTRTAREPISQRHSSTRPGPAAAPVERSPGHARMHAPTYATGEPPAPAGPVRR
ncbi:hypothetical protein GCM10018962_01270 [Dactylosporangium matsuzakiense]|uniref:Uncharacterized protein n=1 Tax=Dactylosporangium matsuzakiense TaxID=53360 RepID=A0A9W6KDB2_9ACTN|nr:hypothetical protein GCM10017581_017270 [Dactylosporangium matsuzakiense]